MRILMILATEGGIMGLGESEKPVQDKPSKFPMGISGAEELILSSIRSEEHADSNWK